MSKTCKSAATKFTVLCALFLIGGSLATSVWAQSYTWQNVAIGGGGGFIPGIIFSQTQPNLMYLRTDIGGAYRWNPATNTWIPLLDSMSSANWNWTGVESLATDPVNPNNLYLAVGTYTNEFTTQNGAVLRSTDQGNTFQITPLPFKVGGNMPGRSMGERLAIDPNKNSTLYLGTRSGNGLWRSIDSGVTWSKVTGFPDAGTYHPPTTSASDTYDADLIGVAWVTFDPRSGTPGNGSKIIYVGVADEANSIYRSTDGGVTWAAVPGQPNGFLPHHGKLVPSTGMLYITYSNGAGPYDGTSGDVWKFNTATGVWTLISPFPSTDTADDYYGYGGLAIDALHPNTIMVSALNSWWPDTLLFRSLDGGTTWTEIWNFSSYPNRTLRYTQDITAAPWLNFGVSSPVPPVPSPKLGWMVGSLEIDPFNSDHLLYGTGATLYGTNNLTTWDSNGLININVEALGVEETSVTGLISPPTGAHLFSTLGDIGGFRHDSLTTPSANLYSIPFAGTYTSIDYAELNPNFLTRAGNGTPNASPPVRSTAFTFDGGTSWFQGNNDPAGLVSGGGTIAAAADASRVVWSPGDGTAVVFSTDNGNTWSASTGIPAGGIVAADRVNPAQFYGFANGAFYTSINGGVSFTATGATGLPPAGTAVHFKAVPGIAGDVWLAGSGLGLWHSTNAGTSFTPLASVTSADTIGFGRPAPGQTYDALFVSGLIGGVAGIFRSDNEGTTWVRINDDQHQYGTTSAAITGDPRIYGQVYVSTNGRGIILGTMSASNCMVVPSAPAGLAAAAASSSQINLSWTAVAPPTGCTVTSYSVFRSTTSGFTPSASNQVGSITGATTFSDTGLTASTAYFYKLEAVDPDGVSAASSQATATTGAPAGCTTVAAAPTGLRATATSSSQINLSWTAVTPPSGCTVTYSVFRSTSSGFTPSSSTQVATGLTTTSFSSTGLTAATGYFFKMEAVDASGASAASAQASATTPAASCTTVPSAPTGLTATTTTSSQINLSWTAVTPPSGCTVTYSVFRSTSSGFTPSSANQAATGVTTTSFSDTGLTAATTYFYKMEAVDAAGVSPASAQASAATQASTGNGGVTVTPVVSSSSAYFNEEDIKIANTSTLTALSITVVVQRTTGISFSGQYNTAGGQILQRNSSTSNTVTYQFTLNSGQTLGTGAGWTFAAQTSGTGTAHPTTGDTYAVTYTTGGQSFTQTGHF